MSFGAQQSASTSESKSFIAKEQLPYLENLWGQAQGAVQPGLAGSIGSAISGQLSPQLNQAMQNLSALTDPSGQIATQAGALQSGLGNMFRNEIMPSIEGASIGMGGFGGGRQGVAEGVAAGQLANAYQQGLGQITAQANQTALGAAGMMPQLGQAAAANAMLPAMAGLDPLTRLAAIIGSPTILNKSTSESESSGFNFGLSF